MHAMCVFVCVCAGRVLYGCLSLLNRMMRSSPAFFEKKCQ